MSGHTALHTVRAAAAGVGSQVAWQVWSRVLAFVMKAAAVRAAGPAQFAFAEIRLALLTAAAMPVALGVRKVALRSPSDDTAAALVFCAAAGTAVLAATLGAAFACADPAHAGPILLTALQAALNGLMERGRVFATRRERYSDIARARALARIVGGAVTSASVVVLPAHAVGLYAVVVGNVAHGATLWALCEHAAGPVAIPRVGPRMLRRVLTRDDVEMAAIATWQTVFKSVLGNGESIVLDVTCVDPVKGAYKLAANIGSMLARFFSEALEEQSYNVFSRFSPAFRGGRGGDGGRGGEEIAKRRLGETEKAADESAEMRAQCVTFLYMALKCSLLISLLIAFVGPSFSYAFLRLLYGAQWADATPAPELLSLYFAYLVFTAANGVTEALVFATASTAKLREQSMFSVALSALYMAALCWAGRRHSAAGIVAVNCANMAARTLYSTLFYVQLTGAPARTLVQGAMPRAGVLLVLALARALCGISRRAFFPAFAPESTRSLLYLSAQHAVSGAVSVAMFAAAVYVFEQPLRSYLGVLRGSRGTPKDSSASAHVD